jgi:hypothetical protein
VDLKQRHKLNIVAINASWGSSGYSQSLHNAILRAAKAGILFVAAAGNDGANNDTTGSYPANLDTRVGTSTQVAATYNAVISVAAIDRTGALAAFSNRGAKKVHLGAPGVDIYSTVPTNAYAMFNGTSMATPHVTGAIALYASTHATATAPQIRDAILSSVIATPSLTNLTVTGGRLNLSSIIGVPAPPAAPAAPIGVTALAGDRKVTLSWTTVSNANSYIVRRGDQPGGPYYVLSGSVQAPPYVDLSVTNARTYFYVIAGTNAAGTSANSAEVQATPAAPLTPPIAPSGLTSTSSAPRIVTINWQDNSSNEVGFRIYRRTVTNGFSAIATVSSNVVTYSDASVASDSTYIYAAAAYNAAGESVRSAETTFTTEVTPEANLIQFDHGTGGSWKGVYGKDGFNIIRDTAVYPSYLTVLPSGYNEWLWTWRTADRAALERAGSADRLAACWYAASGFRFEIAPKDSAVRRVSLYFLDWDKLGREQRVEIYDPRTGVVLSSWTVSQFMDGVYLTWDIKGRVVVRVVPVKGNAVISGLFFDSALPTVSAPAFSPAGGSFTNSVTVGMTSATPGAKVYYTLDGSTPDTNSFLFTTPITLTNSAAVRARAFSSGMLESAVANASYTVVQPAPPSSNSASFTGTNIVYGGSWKGRYGTQGHLVASDSQALPSYVTMTPSGKTDWIWQYSTTDARALERNTVASRMASCWYSATSFEVNLKFSDTQAQNVAFYCLDWDRANRVQKIEVLDADTGAVLHTQERRSFFDGVYLNYVVTGNVTFRFANAGPANAVLSGIFFD